MKAPGPSDIQEHIAAIARQGYTILEGAISAELRSELITELQRLESVRPGGDISPGPFTGYVTRRWFDLLNDAPVWQQVPIHRWVLEVLPKILGDGFLLSTMGTAVIGPGEKAQPLHVDDTVYAFPRPHPNLVCNTMWAIDDFTAENGATMVVPESNTWDHDPVAGAAYESIPLIMPAGSIAFVLGTCYHGAGANESDSPRRALTINYCNGSMRQQENLMLGVHPSRLMKFSTQLQDLLGFRMCNGAGHLSATDPRQELERRYGKGSSAP